jgi:hypothetical protein
LGGAKTESEQRQSLSESEIGGGLKDALRVGADTVLARLGANGGFEKDPAVHIPLPGSLGRVKAALERVGMGSLLKDLEQRLNGAAELAMPKARALFLRAIDEMTLQDVMKIYRGSDDAATRYFQGKMSAPLAQEMRPAVDQSLAQAGAVDAYAAVITRYNSLPLVRPVQADLGDYVVQKGMDGIFHYLAQEEAAIRKDPVKRSTELLRRVFGK